MEDKDLVLYTYFRSSSAYRVRIVLYYKDIPFQSHPIHLLKNEQLSKDFVEKNAMAQVPLLEQGDFHLSQSMAIIEYLDEAFAGPKIFPKDMYSKAIVRQMCEIINSGIQPLQNLSVMQRLSQGLKASDSQVKDWNRYWITKGLHAIEKLIKTHGVTYGFGDQITAVDVFLIPQVYNAQRFHVDLSPFQHILKVVENCHTLKAFQEAHPDRHK